MKNSRIRADVAVAGGGIAGLAAAAYLARAGRRVVLCEAAKALGGRARTIDRKGFLFNLGPHALYSHGAAVRVLRELGVPYRGLPPPLSGAFAVHQGRLRTFPAGVLSLLVTGLLSPAEKVEAARFLSGLARLDTSGFRHLTLAEWAAKAFRSPGVRDLVLAVTRVANYADARHIQGAGAALEQLRLAFRGVLYLDGGWQTLVDGLGSLCDTLGVERMVAARVEAVERDPGVRGLSLADGRFVEAPAVVLAVAPAEADRLTRRGQDAPLGDVAACLTPIRVACLNVALRRLPKPRHLLACGIDEPVYFAVHSAVARLAPAEGAVIQLARYCGDAPGDSGAARRSLHDLLDATHSFATQPGWRDKLVHEQFLPEMTVSNAVVPPNLPGHPVRPPVSVGRVPGLYLAGDWVGPHGMLADAALSSARRAAELILTAAPLATAVPSCSGC